MLFEYRHAQFLQKMMFLRVFERSDMLYASILLFEGCPNTLYTAGQCWQRIYSNWPISALHFIASKAFLHSEISLHNDIFALD